MLAHPRSEYVQEFRQVMLDRHADRVLEVRDRMRGWFEAQLENHIAARLQHGKTDRYEAKRRSLDNMKLDRKLLAEALHKALDDEEEKLGVAVIQLERWAAT